MKLLLSHFSGKKNIAFFNNIFAYFNLNSNLFFYKKIFIKKEKFPVPIICIGNIYIGGTGKHSYGIKISDILRRLNKNPAIIKKFYKNQNDEIQLIKKNKNLVTAFKRKKAINEALKKNLV